MLAMLQDLFNEKVTIYFYFTALKCYCITYTHIQLLQAPVLKECVQTEK